MTRFAFRRFCWWLGILEDIFELRRWWNAVPKRRHLSHDSCQMQNQPSRLTPRFPQMSDRSLVQVPQRHFLGFRP